MNNVQDKIDSGMSRIQDSIDQNKNKIDEKMTISKYNKIIDEVENKRRILLEEIGILVYEKIRQGEITNLEIREACKPLIGFDYTIYDNKKKIQEINNKKNGLTCDCGARISLEDKFCGGCGTKVEIPDDNTEYIECSSCETIVPENSNFCPCCGYKIEFDFSTFEI
ncbi:zinc ribbon domain-containing protein [Romboutsia hominis]|uniref:Double zinc ribbon n=1 Tax=Romboutsia hominis TaxID=1507512 RepID=A0A2P2BSK5_9FIRM|nr:zinc ribbon domain-containing protein [Romboutsia hominis]CEI73353.1 Double zinc ribbon [Romboutsia hominis]